MSRKRQKNQRELAFTEETRSEAPTNDERVELRIASLRDSLSRSCVLDPIAASLKRMPGGAASQSPRR